MEAPELRASPAPMRRAGAEVCAGDSLTFLTLALARLRWRGALLTCATGAGEHAQRRALRLGARHHCLWLQGRGGQVSAGPARAAPQPCRSHASQRACCVCACAPACVPSTRALRPLMAEVAHTLSDMVIITNDSPRREPPESIVQVRGPASRLRQADARLKPAAQGPGVRALRLRAVGRSSPRAPAPAPPAGHCGGPARLHHQAVQRLRVLPLPGPGPRAALV